jgi:predicted nucleic acid-binding protein
MLGRYIHLDTNLLILMLAPSTGVAIKLAELAVKGNSFCCSAIAWAEFLNGPVNSSQIKAAEDVVQDRILNFTKEDARLAAELFNVGNRKRGTQVDCMIAASVILANGVLATLNKDDFRPFAAKGLELLEL